MGLDISKLRGPDCTCDATDAYKQMLHSVHVRYHGVHGGGAARGGCDACNCLGGGDDAFGGDGDDAPAVSEDAKSRAVLTELKNYESSLAATAKEETVRRIAHAMKRAGIAVDPEGDLDTVVEELQRQLPNPKNGKTFASSAAAQEKVCRVIADVLNDEFSPGVHEAARKYIDTSMNAAEVCRAVAERAHSFSRGVNVEFLAVHVSIKNALRNIQLLEGIIDAAHKKLSARIAKHGDAQLTADLEDLLDLSARARAEQKRAVDVLKDILHVQIPESAKLLEIALQEHSDLNATIKKLRLAPGTSQFGNTLASAISGLGTAAGVAARAHRALKAAGVSVRDFVDSPSFKEFRAKLDARVESGAVPTKDLAAFLRAAEDLRRAFAEREREGFRAALERGDNVAAMLDVEGGADVSVEGGADSDAESDAVRGGADDDGAKTERERRMARQQASSTLIIKDFALRLARHYDDFLAAVKGLGPHLGKEIPLTDHTDKLQEAIRAIQQDNPADKASTRVELAIMGRYADAGARKLKDTFIARLRLIERACEELLGLEMYRPASARFSKVLDAVSAIEKTIAFYSKTFEEGLGRGTGEAKDVSLVLPEIAKSSYSLQEAVTEFLYLYYVARVRANLAKTSRELDTYGEKYEDLLENAIKNRLSLLEWERYVYVEGLKKIEYTGVGGAPVPAIVALGGVPARAITQADINQTLPTDAARKKAVEHITEEYKVKSAFYRAIQALDLYMKEFTVAIAKNPDAIDDIKKMFDGAQVIARWFSEMTGDSICKAFEQSDSLAWATGDPADALHRADVTDIRKHYYDKFGAAVFRNAEVDVGMPGEGIPVADGPFTESKKQIKSAYENFQALKNLVNAFARIGDKFGGQELHAKVFMSPAQIYKALLDYLKHSALSINRTEPGARKNIEHQVTRPVDAAGAALGAAAAAAAARFVEIPLPATMLGQVIALAPGPALYGAGPYQAYFSRVDIAEPRFDNYAKERPLFATAVKAMAAKILTVVGVFDMFERTTPLYELTPVRTIIGGADGDVVPDVAVEPAAVELYYRLPLLAEFYRKLLQFNVDTGAADPQIALIADFEGTFSGIIKFMFLKTQDRQGEYSESEVRIIVREVNAIFAHFAERQAEGTTSAALTAFIAEINRRYGIVKRADYDTFAEANKRAMELRDGTAIPRQVETNYAILPGEDEVEDRPLPSVYIPKGWEAPSAADPFKDRPDLGMKDMLRNFRKKLDTEFATKRNMFDAAGGAAKIRQAQGEIERATTPAARFKVVSALIRGEAASVDNSVSLVFHETVVVGLNTLSAIETMLRTFHQELKYMDPVVIEGAIMDAFYRVNTLAVAPAPLAAFITNEASLVLALNAMRSIGAGSDRTIANGNGAVKLPADFGSDIQMRGYLADALRMRCETDLNVTDLVADTIVTSAAGGGGDLLQGTIAPANAHWDGTNPSALDAIKAITENITRVNLGTAAAIPVAEQPANLRLLRALRTIARLLTNYPQIMFRFLEAIFAISCDGLVDVHVSKGGIRADFSKLQSLVEEIFADVKYNFELLRPSISADIAKRFSDVENKGSIGWIDTHLIDKFFRGREFQDPATTRANSREGIEDLISKVFKNLTRQTHVKLNLINAAAVVSCGGNHCVTGTEVWDSTPALQANYQSTFEWYGATFARIGWYDALRPNSGVVNDAAVALEAPRQNFPDGTDDFGGMIATGRPDRNTGIRKHPRAAAGAAFGAHGGVAAAANGENANILPLYSKDSTSIGVGAGSLMFNFNRLVARYLLTLTDSAAGNKIYLNLINAFANGVASASITSPNVFAHPDIIATEAAAVPFRQRGDPKANSILLASLAWVLQRIRNDSNPSTNVADHLVTTLTDVPLYIKEAMRANLPSFVRLFNLIASKSDFIKQVMQKTEAKCNRPNLQTVTQPNNAGALIKDGFAIAAGLLATEASFPGTLGANSLELLDKEGATKEGARELRVRFAAIFDAIAGGALALSGAASETLKELGDSPIYLQTGEGSIEQYTMRFGKAPLMPFSLALYMLRNNDGNVAAGMLTPKDGSPITLAFPRHSIGTPNFKMMYGMRGIIAPAGMAPLSYDQMPGVQTALAIYNGARARSGRGIVDPARYLRFAQAAATAIRWITDARCYKGMLSAERTIREVVLVNPDVAYAAGGAGAAAAFGVPAITLVAPLAGAAGGGGAAVAVERQYAYAQLNGITLGPAVNPRTAAYALGADAQLENVLSIVESSDQEDSVNDIAKAIGAAASDDVAGRRQALQIQNLVDMNIVPINVHAMMRGVPLANLYNYEYTFEQFACQMMGEQYKVLSDAATVANPKNTTQAFLQMLADPYRTITPDYYGSDCTNAGSEGFIHRIFRGDNGLGMGRPKFLSDQLFNKPLFGSVYQSRQDWDEGGPAVGIGKARGYAEAATRSVGHTLRVMQRQMAGDYMTYMVKTGFMGIAVAILRLTACLGGGFPDTLVGAAAAVLQQHPVPAANVAQGASTDAKIRAMAAANVPGYAPAAAGASYYYGERLWLTAQEIRGCAYSVYLVYRITDVINAAVAAAAAGAGATADAAIQAITAAPPLPPGADQELINLENAFQQIGEAMGAIAVAAAGTDNRAGLNSAVSAFRDETPEVQAFRRQIVTIYAATVVATIRGVLNNGGGGGGGVAAGRVRVLSAVQIGNLRSLYYPETYCVTAAVHTACRDAINIIMTRRSELAMIQGNSAARNGPLRARIGGNAICIAARDDIDGNLVVLADIANNTRGRMIIALTESMQRDIGNFIGVRTDYGAAAGALLAGGAPRPGERIIEHVHGWRTELYRLLASLPAAVNGATVAEVIANRDLVDALRAVEALPKATGVGGNADAIQIAVIAAADAYRAGAILAQGTLAMPMGLEFGLVANLKRYVPTYYVVNVLEMIEVLITQPIISYSVDRQGAGACDDAIDLAADVNAIMMAYRYLAVAIWNVGALFPAGAVDDEILNGAPAINVLIPNNRVIALDWLAARCDQALETAPMRTAARAGTASLTWLGPEVPADDDLSGPKRTHEYEAIHKVSLAGGPTAKQRLESVGIARFNTHFVRDMFFISNVNRLVRLKLNRELTHSRSVLRASHLAVASEVLEYNMDPFGPNAVFESRTRGTYSANDDAFIGEARYNDSDARMRTTM